MVPFASILRSTEEVRLPMFVSAASILLKTSLGYLLIFGRLGFPEMGIQGGAVSTVIARFFELGEAGAAQAAARYAAHRLDYDQRGALGLALQGLLEHTDAFVCEQALERASGCVWLTAQHCGFEIAGPVSWSSQTRYPRTDRSVVPPT